MSTASQLAQEPLAPWAEIVPNMSPMTVDDLHAILDDGYTYEVVQGVLVRMPMNGLRASSIGYRLFP